MDIHEKIKFEQEEIRQAEAMVNTIKDQLLDWEKRLEFRREILEKLYLELNDK